MVLAIDIDIDVYNWYLQILINTSGAKTGMCWDNYANTTTDQGSFCACTQPMRDGVTM